MSLQLIWLHNVLDIHPQGEEIKLLLNIPNKCFLKERTIMTIYSLQKKTLDPKPFGVTHHELNISCKRFGCE